MKLKLLAAVLAGPGVVVERVHAELLAFEHGGPIRPDLFTRLVAALGIDILLVEAMIAEYRLEAEERWRRDFLGFPDRLSWQYRPTVGGTRLLPDGTTLEQASVLAGEEARTRGGPINLYIGRELRQFDRNGQLVRVRELAAWSHYPFHPHLFADQGSREWR